MPEGYGPRASAPQKPWASGLPRRIALPAQVALNWVPDASGFFVAVGQEALAPQGSARTERKARPVQPASANSTLGA